MLRRATLLCPHFRGILAASGNCGSELGAELAAERVVAVLRTSDVVLRGCRLYSSVRCHMTDENVEQFFREYLDAFTLHDAKVDSARISLVDARRNVMPGLTALCTWCDGHWSR